MKKILAVMIYFGLVLLRWQSYHLAEANLAKYTDKQIRLKGKISSESILEDGHQQFKIGQVEVWVKPYPRFSYGDNVQVIGKLQRRMINKYYSRFRLMYPQVELFEAERRKIIGLDIKGVIYNIRDKIEIIYNSLISEPEASLLSGIVLGLKRNLSAEFWQKLQTSGTLHIVVASGYNVTVIMGVVISYLAGWIKRSRAIMVGFLAIAAYTVMAGGEAAIVRAAIMGSLVYLGQLMGKRGDSLRLLVAAVMLMVLYKPVIVFDVGFQLSVMATLGLLVVEPKFKALRNIRWIGKDVAETTAAQMAVWPILVITFGNLSLFSIVVNSLILWLVPIIMTLGAMMAVGGLIWLPLGRVISWLVYGPLWLMIGVIEWFGSRSWMRVEIGQISWWWGLVYYGLLIVWLWRSSEKQT